MGLLIHHWAALEGVRKSDGASARTRVVPPCPGPPLALPTRREVTAIMEDIKGFSAIIGFQQLRPAMGLMSHWNLPSSSLPPLTALLLFPPSVSPSLPPSNSEVNLSVCPLFTGRSALKTRNPDAAHSFPNFISLPFSFFFSFLFSLSGAAYF